jgi:hypothetical protein
LIPTCPTLTKVLPKVAHAFLYTLIDFFQSHQTVPSRCYLTFFHFPERSIALVKRLVHQKELKLIPTCPTLTKVLLQGSTRILIYIDGLLSVAPNCAQAVAILPSSIFPNVQLHYSKRLVHQKELKLIRTCPTLTKVLLQGSTRILIYIDGLLSVAPNCAQAVAILPSSIFRTFNCTSKTTGSPKGAEIDPNLPHANKSVT